MLFRTSEGKLVEIKKYDFKNDTLYYEKLIQIKNINAKLEKTLNHKNNKHTDK